MLASLSLRSLVWRMPLSPAPPACLSSPWAWSAPWAEESLTLNAGGRSISPWPSHLGPGWSPKPSLQSRGRLMTPLRGWELRGLQAGCLAHSQIAIRVQKE